MLPLVEKLTLVFLTLFYDHPQAFKHFTRSPQKILFKIFDKRFWCGLLSSWKIKL